MAPLREDFHLLLLVIGRVINQVDREVLTIVDLKESNKIEVYKAISAFLMKSETSSSTVSYLEVSDSESGREDGALKGAAACDGFVGVERRAGFVTENLFDDSFYPRNPVE